jgi:hypothetical protein
LKAFIRKIRTLGSWGSEREQWNISKLDRISYHNMKTEDKADDLALRRHSFSHLDSLNGKTFHDFSVEERGI